ISPNYSHNLTKKSMNWDNIRKDFKRFLSFERNLSNNSIVAYINDVEKIRVYCEDNAILLEKFSTKDFQNFLVWINGFNISPYSQARIISGLKSFFNFLQLEYNFENNPAALIETPRLNRKIPDVLDIAEIDQLIAAIDLSQSEGMRNKAMLEVLYGCGLRVSELINIRISNLHLEVEFIKIEGKGNKERLIPIGQQAIKYLKIYLEEVRPKLSIKSGNEDFVFLNRRGAQLTRVMVFIIIKDLGTKIGLKKKISPHTF